MSKLSVDVIAYNDEPNMRAPVSWAAGRMNLPDGTASHCSLTHPPRGIYRTSIESCRLRFVCKEL